MQGPLVIQVSKIIYLFVADFGIEYGGYTSLWQGGELPQLASLHYRGNVSCERREQEQEQEQSRPLQLIVNSKPLLSSRQKLCYTLSVHLTS
jgi:hypothetical protein